MCTCYQYKLERSYSLNSTDLEDLAIFDTLEEAYTEYLKRLTEIKNGRVKYIPDHLWIVWIDNNQAVQFDRLEWKTIMKFIDGVGF